jgi:branched-chain amino acid transport system permease protein
MTIERARALNGLVLLGVMVLFVLAASQLQNDYLVRVMMLIGINILLAVSLALASGFTGVFSLGQIGFMAIGAYASALLTIPPSAKTHTLLPGLPPWLASLDLVRTVASGLNGLGISAEPADLVATPIALVIAASSGALFAACVALLVGIPLMRLNGNYVSVATMGFLVIVNAIAINLDTVTRGSRGLGSIPSLSRIWIVYLFVAIALYVVWRIRASPFGRAMLAQRENVSAAQAMGIDILRTRLLAFVIGAFFSAVAGALWAHMITAVAPAAFYFTYTVNVIVMVVVGGMGSVTGATLGAVLLTLLPELLRGLEGGATIGPFKLPLLFGLSNIILAVTFVLVMIYRRGGLLGDRELPLFWARKPPASKGEAHAQSLPFERHASARIDH